VKEAPNLKHREKHPVAPDDDVFDRPDLLVLIVYNVAAD